MSIFGRRPNPEEVATQLIEGLENGSLTLNGEPESVSVAERAAALLADRLAKTVETQIGAVLGPLQTHFNALAEHAAAVMKSAEETRRRAEAEAAAVLAEARAVLAEAVKARAESRANQELIVQMGSEPIVFDPNGAILKGVIGGGKAVITGFEEVKSFKSDPSDPKAKFRDT